MRKILLVDMDSILVDMHPVWFDKYFKATKEHIEESTLTSWDLRKQVSQPEVLSKILEEDGFFFDLPAIRNAPEVFEYIAGSGKFSSVFIVTQPPRMSDFALRDKKRWVSKNMPWFPLENMIFAHKKYLVSGDILFDDNPLQLESWRSFQEQQRNCRLSTITIDYPYNSHVNVTHRFRSKDSAWQSFAELVKNDLIF